MKLGVWPVAVACAASACSLFESFEGYSDDWGKSDASTAGSAGSGATGGFGASGGWPTGGGGSGGSGASGALAGSGGDTSDAEPQCTGGLVACSGGCVDTKTDPVNCGGCGVSCIETLGALSLCSGGTCSCKPGTTECATGCTRLDSDPLNCGGCGDVVLAEKYCVNGFPECRPRTNDCKGWWYQSTYYIECEYTCTDNSGDGSHCVDSFGTKYRCIGSSSATSKCIDGDCSTAPCPSGRIECPSTLTYTKSCFDKLRDSNHCGTCSNQCQPDETCAQGACVKYWVVESFTECPPGTKPCDTPLSWAHARICVAGSACPT